MTRRVNQDKDSINKYEIVRTVLEKLNERGDATLRVRREVVRHVVEFEDFSACWPSDQLKAKGLVAQIRQVVNVKDSFTRMREERERERKERLEEQKAKLEREQRRRERIASIKSDFFALFKEQNPQRRGKLLEAVLNRLFAEDGILLKTGVTLQGGWEQTAPGSWKHLCSAERNAAVVIRAKSAERTLSAVDLGGKATTREITKAIIRRLV